MKIILIRNFIIIDLDGGCISFITHTHNTHTHTHTCTHTPPQSTNAHTCTHKQAHSTHTQLTTAAGTTVEVIASRACADAWHWSGWEER